MRGTLSLPKPLPGWKNLFKGNTYSEIELDNSTKLRLLHTSGILGTDETYTLLDHEENTLSQWFFNSNTRETSLNITEHPSLIYSIKPIKFIPHFITPDNKIPASLQLSGSSRTFKLDDIEFKHKDYQSHIHFRCPDNKLRTAIIIAQLLFTPPIRHNDPN